MYTEHKAQHYARTPRAMGMPGIPYVLEYVLEYFVQEVCQEYLMLNVGEYILYFHNKKNNSVPRFILPHSTTLFQFGG